MRDKALMWLKRLLLVLVPILIAKPARACSPLPTPSVINISQAGNWLYLDLQSQSIYNCTYSVELELACMGGTMSGLSPFYYTSPGFQTVTNPFTIPQCSVNLTGLCQGGVYQYRFRQSQGGVFSPWSSIFTFTMPGVPIPTTMSVTASPTLICYPQTSQLTASVSGGCGGGGGATYSWSPTAGLSCTNCANPLANPSVTTTYTCYAYGSGQANCWSVNGTVTVVSPPSGLGLVVSNQTICAGATTTISASGAGTYTWNTGSNSNSIVVSPPTNTTYVVSGGAPPCVGSATVNIITQTQPNTPTVTPNNFQVCQGTSSIMTAVSNVTNFAWFSSPGGTIIASPQATMAVPNATGAYQWYVAATAGTLLPAVTYSFTNCAATGQNGPTQAQVNTAYTGSNLQGSVTSVSGIQTWTVPLTGNYSLVAAGASGGNANSFGGRGRIVSGVLNLTAGTVLKILVGQMGVCTNTANQSSGGGGGSFISDNLNNAILVGGGGGGFLGPVAVAIPSSDGNIAQSGFNSLCGTGTGGAPGNGGTGTTNGWGGGGGGFTTNGTNASACVPTFGTSFVNGGLGGGTCNNAPGGFGGGAGTHGNTGGGGGGGGYGGGGGSNQNINPNAGGGGGSYFAPAMTSTSSPGMNIGMGYVQITLLPGGGTCQSSLTPVNFTVVPTPSLSVSNQTICAGASTTLSASGGLTYTWSTGANTSSIVVAPNTNTFYTVASGTAPCTGQATVNVTTQTQPNAPTVTPNNFVACTGGSVLTAVSNVTNFAWYSAPGGSIMAMTNTLAVPNGTGAYQWYVAANAASLQPGVTYSFTNCGATGQNGPTQAQVNTAYTGSNLQGSVTSVSGIQTWTVPTTGNYSLVAAGASGGNANSFGGRGKVISGIMNLTAGTVLKILVGQMGVCTNTANQSSGGGGGSYITDISNTPMLVGGGGGGFLGPVAVAIPSSDGNIAQPGFNSLCGTGTGGAAGNGGTGTNSGWGGGGGGFNTNGTNASACAPTFGTSFVNGGTGGGTCNNAPGGFGGGAGTHGNTGGGGGGGGYSGGGGSNQNINPNAGGGGGSYFSPSMTGTTNIGNNIGMGYINITLMPGGNVCQSTLTPVNFTILPTPTLVTSNQTICIGATTTISATGGNTYTWSTGANTSSIVVAPNTNTFYTVASGTAPCTSQATVNITTQVQPNTPTVTPNNFIACTGGTILTAVSNVTNFAWYSTPGGTVMGLTNTLAVPNGTGAYQWYVAAGAGTLQPGVTYSFINCAATGQNGPTQAQVNTAYTGSNLQGSVTSVSGIQTWTVPTTGNYSIVAAGASGGNANSFGGRGRIVSGVLNLTAGTVLKILVGQMGVCTNTANQSSGGGGGSFISDNLNNPIAVGGGGGGFLGPVAVAIPSSDGNIAQPGFNSLCGTGTGGAPGNGGTGTTNGWGGGGGGFNTNGTNASACAPTFGTSFINGGLGGGTCNNAPGGFGGGAGTHGNTGGGGGGGGYSGGGGSNQNINPNAGGGGGSYLAPAMTSTSNIGTNIGMGYVNITLLPGGGVCQSSLAPVNFTIIPTPTIVASNQTICAGATTTISATGGNTYTWSTGANTSSIVVAPNTNTFYTVASGTAPCTSQATVNITTQPQPNQPTVTPNNFQACQNSGTVMTAVSNVTNFAWYSAPGGSLITQNATLAVPNGTGTYQWWVAAGAGTLQPGITYSFTNCGATGQNGPSQAQVNTAYTGSNLQGSVTSVSGIQTWTVPSSGSYSLVAAGASGGNANNFGGRGIVVSGVMNLTAGTVLKILVGQMGICTNTANQSSGGGGGSYITDISNTPMLVGGGGGGFLGPVAVAIPSSDGNIAQPGFNSLCGTGTGGAAGNGGNGTTSGWGGGGGGFNTNGTNASACVPTFGTSFVNGGTGGGTCNNAPGGFGGGAGTHGNTGGGGGGGGYSGGGGSNQNINPNAGGGGGSYFSPSMTGTTNIGNNIGMGYIQITKLPGGGVCQTSLTPVNFTIISTPTLVVSNQTICAGASTTISATGGNTYTWSTGANTSSIVVAPNTNTFYTVASGVAPCTGQVTVNITAQPQPNSPVVTPNNFQVCQNTGSVLTAVSNVTNFAWYSTPGGSVITQASTLAIPNATGAYQYYVAAGAGTLQPAITYSFTNCAATGQNGPTQAQVNTAYTGSNLQGSVTSVSGIQTWTVPTTGNYSIVAAGASGGNANSFGGRGRIVSGITNLTAGTVLKILVGQMGVCTNTANQSSGGGGGSFISDNSNNPIAVGGGGGGFLGPVASALPNTDGNIATSGFNSICGTGIGGAGGAGGAGTTNGWGGGGGGFNSNGTNAAFCSPTFGSGFVNGGQGGGTCNNAPGGFGGGAGTHGNTGGGGGGGGYSGGGGSNQNISPNGGGGGGSYLAPTMNSTNNIGTNIGMGYVNITLMSGGGVCQTSLVPVNFTVITTPTLVVSNQTICAGQNTTLTVTGGNTYTWSTGANTSSIVVAPNTNTFYTVASGTAPCTGQVTLNVVAQPMPNAATVTPNNAVMCSGTVLTAVSNVTTFAWYTTPGGTILAQSPTLAVPNATGAFQYYVAAGAGTLQPAITYSFTNCSATGQNGPSQAQVNTAYAGSNLQGSVTSAGGIQNWTVPTTGSYSLVAAGASGGNANSFGGRGAIISGVMNLTAGTVLKILVGQMGICTNTANQSSGGGGGSYITDVSNTPILVGGGGAGFLGPVAVAIPSSDANFLQPGFNSLCGTGTGGAAGNGGTGTNSGWGGGGGGFNTNGTNASACVPTFGTAFVNGGTGGGTCNNAPGGFGGGAGTHGNTGGGGGGGGYSGGGGSNQNINPNAGGGGGSYFGASLSNTTTIGKNIGMGYVNITLIGSGGACQSTLTVVNGTVISSPTIVPAANPTQVCVGSTTSTLTVSGATSYTWFPGGVPGSSIVVNPTVTTVYTVQGVSGNGCMDIKTVTVTACQALPVQLVSFDAVKMDETVKLNWLTKFEKNSDKFIVERSQDAGSWTEVCTVKGAGNSNSDKRYECYDMDPLQGISYYRLKAVDFNHGFGYSDIKMMEFSHSDGTLLIHPNPAHDKLYVNYIGRFKSGSFIITDARGRVMMNETEMKLSFDKERVNATIDLGKLDPGVYFFIANEDGVRYARKFIVE